MSGINDSNRIDQIARLLKDYKEREETRSETIPYRDALKTIEVIRIDPNIL